jgi:hypothetical protein
MVVVEADQFTYLQRVLNHRVAKVGVALALLVVVPM